MTRRRLGGPEFTEFELWVVDILISIEERLGALMGAQEDVDTATATIAEATSRLNDAAPVIQGEIGSGTVDTSALNTALAPLVTAVQGIQALAGPSSTPPAGGGGSVDSGAATDGGAAAGTDG